jgi:hypothetical protein
LVSSSWHRRRSSQQSTRGPALRSRNRTGEFLDSSKSLFLLATEFC